MSYNINIIKILQFTVMHCHELAGQWLTPNHTKKCLESENNVVGHTTFSVWPACQPGPH